LEGLHVLDLLGDEVRDDITLLHIDGNNGDDLDTQVVVEVSTDALDKSI